MCDLELKAPRVQPNTLFIAQDCNQYKEWKTDLSLMRLS